MNKQLFHFKTDISKVSIPNKLNNPFGATIPDIARIASLEFQEFIITRSKGWEYDFRVRNGKMFGVLVVRKEDGSYAYLGTVSGKISRNTTEPLFAPPVFDDSTDNFFINKGMTELTEIGNMIKQTDDQTEIATLKERRSKKSIALQQQLFEHTAFRNILGDEKNVLQIFEKSTHGKPPSAAGECAAPKLLQYALTNDLRPIALVEFWWGNSLKGKERKHKNFYPACKNKCRPILEYMLNDKGLYKQVDSNL